MVSSNLIVLLLPGFGCDIDSMAELKNALKETPEVKQTECLVFKEQVTHEEMILQVQSQYPRAELLLVGFSMGGWVAQGLASRLKPQVKGVILISSWTEAPDRYLDVIQSIRNEIRSGKPLDSLRPLVIDGFVNKKMKELLADRWVAMVNRLGPEVFLRQTKAILDKPNVMHCIANIQCPGLAIAGSLDPLLTPSDQFKHLHSVSMFETMVLDSCGHNLIWEQPVQVSNVVKGWLRETFS